MSFLEIEFPTAIAFHAQGGPGFSTTINQGFSGYEQRNQNWALGLGKWQVELYNKPKSEFEQAYAFWLNVGGRADSFRFKDHKDFQAVAQLLGEADGTETEFQLQKTYTIGGSTYVKPITKPITSSVDKFDGTTCLDTVVIYADGEPLANGVDYEVDYTTGLVTLLATGSPPLIPGDPETPVIITADFEFHYPARFDNDECMALIEESDVAGGKTHVSWPNLTLVEVREPAGSAVSVGGEECPQCDVPPVPIPPVDPGYGILIIRPTSFASDNGSCGSASANPNGGSLEFVHYSPFSDAPWSSWTGFVIPAWLNPSRITAYYRSMFVSYTPSIHVLVGGFGLGFGGATKTGSGHFMGWWTIGPSAGAGFSEAIIASAAINATLEDPIGHCAPCGSSNECTLNLVIISPVIVLVYEL